MSGSLVTIPHITRSNHCSSARIVDDRLLHPNASHCPCCTWGAEKDSGESSPATVLVTGFDPPHANTLSLICKHPFLCCPVPTKAAAPGEPGSCVAHFQAQGLPYTLNPYTFQHQLGHAQQRWPTHPFIQASHTTQLPIT